MRKYILPIKSLCVTLVAEDMLFIGKSMTCGVYRKSVVLGKVLGNGAS